MATEKPPFVLLVFSFIKRRHTMASGRKRAFTDHEAAELLLRIEEWRRECSAVSAKAPINSPVYLAMDTLRAAIDGVAEAITGDREYFWNKQAGIGRVG